MSAEPSTARVLVADDDEDILELVRMVLEEVGYEVVGAFDGEQALSLAIERPPDLCVLDVMMPKLDGCELTRRLRSNPGTSEVPILLLSARTQWESVVQGKEAGADEYITKPFVPEDLQRSVHTLLASSRADQTADAPGEDPEPPALELMEGGQEQTPRLGRLVLVAATDENVVNLVSYRLELGGYEVAAANDFEEAAQLAAERPPDLCVLDSAMPEIDGHKVTRIAAQFSVQDLYEQVEDAIGSSGRRSA